MISIVSNFIRALLPTQSATRFGWAERHGYPWARPTSPRVDTLFTNANVASLSLEFISAYL
jgi:hypothetical protein